MIRNDSSVPTYGVQVSRKVNLGNYESCDVSAWVAGVPFDFPEDQLSFLISSKIEEIVPLMIEEINTRVAEIRSKRSEF